MKMMTPVHNGLFINSVKWNSFITYHFSDKGELKSWKVSKTKRGKHRADKEQFKDVF